MKRAIEGVTICALTVFSLLCLLELGAWIYVQHNRGGAEIGETLDTAKMNVYRKMFPDFSDADIRGMFFTYRQTYAPWVDFRNEDLNYSHVHAHGLLRRTDPEYSARVDGANEIFFFGGSTMQGVHVPDDRTLPSAFSTIAAQNLETSFRVFNYGQPYFYLKQEAMLFFSMLLDGKIPRVAVFLDGLNDIHQPGSSYAGTPFFSPAFEWMFTQPDGRSAIVEIARNTNIYKIISRNLHTRKLSDAIPVELILLNYSFPKGVDRDDGFQKITHSYVQNVKLITVACKAKNIICLFFLQPVPFVSYDQSIDIISMKKDVPQFKAGYEVIKKDLAAATNFYALDDAFAHSQELPYVDAVHYSPYGNRVLAELIYQKVCDHLRRGE